MEQLATFVHVSDLHFGHADSQTHDAKVSEYWKYAPFLDGLLGHEYEACYSLDSFFREMKEKEDAELIITGDFTSWGSDEQFQHSSEFVESKTNFGDPEQFPIGLNAVDFQRRSVPGNHDHFPGHTPFGPLMVGNPSPTLWDILKRCPFSDATDTIWNDVRIRFVAVNTDADVRPFSKDRVLAQGHFVSQLEQLDRQLAGADKEKEIRVLILHHCKTFEHESRLPRHLKMLEVIEPSRKKLSEFIVKNNISVVLSGHVHKPHVSRSTVSNGREEVSILEARCGTTTQLTSLPEHWEDHPCVSEERMRRPPNTLLVHSLEAESNKIYWKTRVFLRGIKNGFEYLGQRRKPDIDVPPELQVSDIDVLPELRVQVWPSFE